MTGQHKQPVFISIHLTVCTWYTVIQSDTKVNSLHCPCVDSIDSDWRSIWIFFLCHGLRVVVILRVIIPLDTSLLNINAHHVVKHEFLSLQYDQKSLNQYKSTSANHSLALALIYCIYSAASNTNPFSLALHVMKTHWVYVLKSEFHTIWLKLYIECSLYIYLLLGNDLVTR